MSYCVKNHSETVSCAKNHPETENELVLIGEHESSWQGRSQAIQRVGSCIQKWTLILLYNYGDYRTLVSTCGNSTACIVV